MGEGVALFVHAGPPRHGVHRYGRILAAATRRHCGVVEHCPGPAGDDIIPTCTTEAAASTMSAAATALSRIVRRHRPMVAHFQFTDQLFTGGPLRAAAQLRLLFAAVAPTPVVVTLHDVPEPGVRHPTGIQRSQAYAEVSSMAQLVLVCSDHERRRLCRFSSVEPMVIPHFIERRAGGPQAAPKPRSVGVLGYLYPGKGHDEVLAGCDRIEPPISLIAVGGAAPGHVGMVTELAASAAAASIDLQITGWVPDADLDGLLRSIVVPVVANRAPSASGSLATWLAAGRRPIVRAGSYVDEMIHRAPGTMLRYDPSNPGELRATIDAVLRRPERGWHQGVPEGLRPDRIAAQHLAAYRDHGLWASRATWAS